MRFTGLEDGTGATYGAYGVPDPEAPYPRDYVIDQNGIVRHWSWEYDPQELIETIDGLLASTAVEEGGSSPPVVARSRLWLAPPAPHPIRPGSEVRYRLAEPEAITLSVYDPAGRLVRTLFDGAARAGEQVLVWDGRDRNGRPVSSGVYFLVLASEKERQTRRAVILR